MKVLEKIPSENARTYAIRILLFNIINLELPPGSSISENEISSVLSLSRTPVREALIELSRMNLVEILPQRGSYISKIDYDAVEESRFVRVVVENAVVKLACDGISDSYIQALQDNITLQIQSFEQHDTDNFLKLDNLFHKLIFESVNKNWSYKIIKEQMIHFDRLRVLSAKCGKNQYTIQDHEDILYAIKRKDAELAQMLMTRHLTRHRLEKSELLQRYPDYFKNI